MYIRLSLSSDYNDKEKGVDLPEIDISKEFEGRAPTQEEVDRLVTIFKRCLEDDNSAKPKVRELGGA